MIEEMAPSDSQFLRDVNKRFEIESERLNAASLSVDTLFACYLRLMSRFGFFTFGPVTIDVTVVEEILERTLPRREEGDDRPLTVGDDLIHWSHLLMEEVRRSGRKKIDELHYLLTFMRLDQGLPQRVFGELGVTLGQVEEYARSRNNPTRELERLYTPEEAAAYFNVHVQTVRTWIRTGRLRARRLTGQRALRIAASDMLSVLEPLEATDLDATDD